MLKKFNLKTRMLVSICTVAFLAFAVTIAFVAFKAGNMAKTEALDKTEQMAFRYGGVVRTKLEVAMDAARTMAQVFEGIKNSGLTPNRTELNSMLKQVLERNPDFVGVWTYWEPNALDGRDAEFVNTEGHDSSGRFIPYWSRGAGKTVIAYLEDLDRLDQLLSKSAGEEIIFDPYKYVVSGKEILVTSIAASIKYNNEEVGVVGIDVALNQFKNLISNIKPFETGYGFLLSNDGSFIAHPKEELVGQNIKDHAASEKVMTAIRQGISYALIKKSKVTGATAYVQFVPINIGSAETPWSLAIGISMAKVMENARGIMYATILIGIISLIVLMVVVFFIAKSIADPMNRVVDGLNEGANQVASASGQVSSASQSLAEGSSEQAAAIEETSSSLEEMASMTKQNADNASQANNLTKEAHIVIGKANDSMVAMAASMEEISRASEETSKIIKTIDEIAFQTNLLALNAAVEAARAGEAGAGFAVVADEVKNLAMRSAKAAKNTEVLIEGTVKKVADGSELVNSTSEAFAAVAESSGKVAELVAEINAASNEQARGIEQVNTAVMDMDKVTQQNAASAEESASASEEMNAQAEQMKSVVEELVVLVEGNGAGAGRGRSRKSRIRKDRKSKRLPAIEKSPATKIKGINKGKEINPQQVIPLDDDSFKDF